MAGEAGKGDTPRPIQNWQQYSDNWDKIFNKKEDDKKVEIGIEADNDGVEVSYKLNIPL